MRRALWNGLAACVAIVALLASPAALAAKKKTPTPAAGASSASTAADKAAKTEKVNLNTADEKAIAGAKGVGDKLAKELVKNRPYKTWEEVSKVKGVGSGKKLDSLKKVLKLTEGIATKDEATSASSSPSKKSSSSSSSVIDSFRAELLGLDKTSFRPMRKLVGRTLFRAIICFTGTPVFLAIVPRVSPLLTV